MAPQRPPRRGNNPPRAPQSQAGRPSDRRGPTPHRKPVAQRPGAGPAHGPRAASGPRPSSAPRTVSGPRPANIEGAERLQKILAHAGVGSRRACEELILQGRVSVGGKIVRELGTKVDPARTPVSVDGQKIHHEKLVYFAVFKPKGYVSTNDDPAGRPRVLDILPEIPQRVYTVGRLDEMSIGLMLLTNDGELANKLAHPKFGVEKLYRVIVAGLPTREVLNQLTDGIWLAEGKVRAKSVRAVARKGEATILELVLAEGKNREVRRMLAKLGHKVMSLTRVAVGPITIKGLTAGQYRPLTGREVDLLQRVAAGEPVPMPWMGDRRPRPAQDGPRRGEGSYSSDRRPANGPPGDRRQGPPSHADRRPTGNRPGQDGPPRRPPGPALYHQARSEQRVSPPRPDGPPRRPGSFQAPRDGPPRRPDPSNQGRPDGPPHPGAFSGPRDGPPRRPGPYPGNDQGPPRRPGPYASHQGGPPPRRPEGNQEGPPRRPGPYASNQGGPPRRPGTYGGDQDGPPRRPGPYPVNQDGPPRSQDRPNNGPRPDYRRSQGPGGPPVHRRPEGEDRPAAFRPGGGQGNSGRGAGHPPGNGRPGPRPPLPARRRPAPSAEPPDRKVIGMGSQAPPRPEPPEVPSRVERPKPRMKRPEGKRPVPRPSGGPRPMPKRRRDGGDGSE